MCKISQKPWDNIGTAKYTSQPEVEQRNEAVPQFFSDLPVSLVPLWCWIISSGLNGNGILTISCRDLPLHSASPFPIASAAHQSRSKIAPSSAMEHLLLLPCWCYNYKWRGGKGAGSQRKKYPKTSCQNVSKTPGRAEENNKSGGNTGLGWAAFLGSLSSRTHLVQPPLLWTPPAPNNLLQDPEQIQPMTLWPLSLQEMLGVGILRRRELKWQFLQLPW